jgi:hypothetical protein
MAHKCILRKLEYMLLTRDKKIYFARLEFKFPNLDEVNSNEEDVSLKE